MQDEPSFRLDGIELLSALSAGTLRDLESACRWRECGADDVVLERDSDENDVFFFGFNVNWKNLPWRNWGTF